MRATAAFLVLLMGCQSTPEVVTETPPPASEQSQETEQVTDKAAQQEANEQATDKAAQQEDDNIIQPPWRVSTKDEAGQCGAALPSEPQSTHMCPQTHLTLGSASG